MARLFLDIHNIAPVNLEGAGEYCLHANIISLIALGVHELIKLQATSFVSK
jgi:hypothetical protein